MNNNFQLETCMVAWLGVTYYGKCNYYALINCIRHCVRGEFIQIKIKFIKIFSFLLIWDKNLGSHTGWPVAKPLWIRPWTWKYITIVIIFPQKIHILSQLSLKRLKNTPVFSILKKENLIQYFHLERLLKRRYRKLSGIYTQKSCQSHQNHQIEFWYFLKFDLQTF